MNPKFDFPIFKGIDIKNWLMQCDDFFQFYPISDDQKLKSVALNLEEEIDIWFLAYFKPHHKFSWSQFAKDVEIKFGDSSFKNGLVNLIDYNKLHLCCNIRKILSSSAH